ncbi:GL10347 [Drosophila persimilis]|uniref:GL10347 n=1 Tax=Drosophila persimilis TaxID=7234 RepID=B4H9M1_DROPE|nr:GL10347 [Drosophila persimilis]
MAAAIATTGVSSRRNICVTQLLLFALLCGGIVGLVDGKHLGDHQHQHQHSAATHHRRRLQRDSRAKDTAQQQCEAVKGYFESIDIHSSGVYNEKGAICGGNCCNNATELELRQKAAGMFEQLLHHHTSSLRWILADNANPIPESRPGAGPAVGEQDTDGLLQGLHTNGAAVGDDDPPVVYGNHESAEVLAEADALYGQQLTDTCKMHLLKMHYCPNCNGHQTRGQPQICNGYCMNVMRGCSAEYAGLLDSPWSSVVEALNNLVTTHIVTDSGIINTIMKLSTKISDAIMHAMGNGPELEQKVKKTCGTPNLSPSLTDESETRLQQHKNSVKWATPPDPDMVRFLSTIEKTKEFYTNIVDNFCDAEYTTDDRLCWTGDRIGDYTQLLIDTGMDRQRYNPEVPWKTQTQVSKLNELVDKLIKIRKSIGAAAPSSSVQSHDIQSDMGREGSGGGGGGQISDDDEEYGGGIHGSGDGSGDGATSIDDRAGETTIPDTEQRENNQSGGASNPLAAPATCLLLTLVTILYRSCS